MDNDSCHSAVNACIAQLESLDVNQATVDTVYECFCDTVKEEMCDQIPHRDIVIRSGSSNKKRRTRKGWWSDTHATKWNILCADEDVWIDTKPGQDTIRAKAEMKDAQRHFDRSVQSAKRHYWRQQQENIQALESSDPKAFGSK